MSRLAATIRCDVRLQWRNGFYYVSALVAVVSIILLRWLPGTLVALILPIVIFQNVITNTYFFVAGLMLLEKGEGTLEAQIVTPLRDGEYLVSKVITLATLSAVESGLIWTLAQGVGPGLIELVVGIVLAAVLFTILGVAIVAPYRSINEYIMPSVFYSMLLSLPMLGYFGVGPRVLYAWHPLQGPLDLMAVRSEPLTPAHLIFSVLVPVLWIVPVGLWGRRAVRRCLLA
jgi:fluoroquinolone transport system permease protein